MPNQRFTRDDVRVIKRKAVYHGFFSVDKLTLRHRLFNGEWSAEFERELFVRKQAAACLVYDPRSDRVGLVEQFRVGALEIDQGPWLSEAVAGIIEPGESVESLILRELKEEANLVPDTLQFICQYSPSAGGSNECIHLFCASANLANAEGVFGLAEENEQTRLVTYPLGEILSNLYKGPWCNASTLIALQWLASNKETFRDIQ